MSLVIALGCPQGVALVADQRFTNDMDGMNYAINGDCKLIQKGSALLGLVGQVHTLKDILEAIPNDIFSQTRTPQEICLDFTDAMKRSCIRKFGHYYSSKRNTTLYFPNGTAILMGLHRDQKPSVYQLLPQLRWFCKPAPLFGLIGQNLHGGCYYLSRFHTRTRTLKQAAYLCFFSLREVISLDGSVGGPIDVWTVSENRIEPRSSEWLQEFEASHKQAIKFLSEGFVH